MRTHTLVAAGIVGLAFAYAGTGAEPDARIVDRTLICRATGVGYPDPLRTLAVGASTYDPSTSDLPAGINVSNGAAGTGTGAAVMTGFRDRPYQSYVSYTRKTCSPSKLRVRLSQKPLSGGPVQFSRRYDCEVPARILVRVQAIFARPPRVLPWGTAGRLVRGYIAVASHPDRGPIAFAAIDGASQQTKVFVSRSSCREDA